MAKLEVFKGSCNHIGAIDEVTEWIEDFIWDKKVVSTNTTVIGEYLFVYVFYENSTD